jgi:hypothetical protein
MKCTRRFNRLSTRAVVTSLLSLVGMTLACDKAPVAPTPPPAVIVAPSITSISPPGGLIGEPVTIAGTGFLPGATLTLDGVPAKVTDLTSTAIMATTPTHAAGVVDVVVTNIGGQKGILTRAFTFIATPVAVTAASPAEGLTNDAVSIVGTGFLTGATLTLDGVKARVTGLTATLITAVSPFHAAGVVDVVVTNPGGQIGTLSGGYTYQVVTITASPSLATSGDLLTMSWVSPSGRSVIGGGDSIALYRVGDLDSAKTYGCCLHTGGVTSGTATLAAPAQPGQYEFRFSVGDTSAARSNPVTVTAAASPSIRR